MTTVSASSNGAAADLFLKLESNKLSDVDETKQVLHDYFLASKLQNNSIIRINSYS